MMLAEISAYDPPVMIAGFCACLMFLFMGANAAMDFWRNIKDKPTGSEILEKARDEFQPKGQYQPVGDYITRLEWNQREKSLNNELRKLSEENQTILKAGKDREQHIISRLDELQSSVANMPGEFMALLANAKNILNGGGK